MYRPAEAVDWGQFRIPSSGLALRGHLPPGEGFAAFFTNAVNLRPLPCQFRFFAAAVGFFFTMIDIFDRYPIISLAHPTIYIEENLYGLFETLKRPEK